MTSSYANQPKCADGCIPFDYCEPQISVNTGKPYRKCHKCNNFVNDPAAKKQWENKPKCSESGTVCSAWDESASTEFTSKAGKVLRRCLTCANLIDDPANPYVPPKNAKTSGFKRSYPQPGPLPTIPEDSHAETINNLNARVGKLEARVETILEQIQKN